MRKSFVALAAVLGTLFTTSTVLADTPAPIDAPKIAAPNIPQLYYSLTRADVYPPQITRNPQPVTVSKGQRVSLTIEFEGQPVPTVEVFRDNILLDLTLPKYGLYSVEKVYILTIRNVQLEDSGTYKFVVKNTMGNVQASAKLTVR